MYQSLQAVFNYLVLVVIVVLLYIHNKILHQKQKTDYLLQKVSSQKDEIESLYEETYAINEELNTHIAEIGAMFEVAQTINSTLDIDKVLERICLEARKILEFDISVILVLDETKENLIVKKCLGCEVKDIQDLNIKIANEGIAGLVARTRKPLFVKNTGDYPEYINIHNSIKQEMMAPLLHGDELIGVFVVDSFFDDIFSKDKLRLLCSFADMASISLYNASLYDTISKSYYETSKALAKAIEAKDIYTKGHCDRVTELSIELAKKIGLDESSINKLMLASTLHDIGKIGIPEHILNKSGSLTQEEYGITKTHPTIGYNILSEIDFLEYERQIIYEHHERYDGKGYPNGLSGNNILIEARILALADSFDAMTSKRSYRNPLAINFAIGEIEKNSGTQFDPRLTGVFIDMVKKDFFKYETA